MVIRYFSSRLIQARISVSQQAGFLQSIRLSDQEDSLRYIFIHSASGYLMNLMLGSLSSSSLPMVGPRIVPPVINTFRCERSKISTVAD